jgi:hypothetical protein
MSVESVVEAHLKVPYVLHSLSHGNAAAVVEILTHVDGADQDNVAVHFRASVLSRLLQAPSFKGMSQYFLCAFHDHLIRAWPYSTRWVASTPDKRSIVVTNNVDKKYTTSFDVNTDLENYVSCVIRCITLSASFLTRSQYGEHVSEIGFAFCIGYIIPTIICFNL